LIIALGQIAGTGIGHLVSGGNELVVDIFRWSLMVLFLVLYLARPKRLGKREEYAKQA
jgi:hypothetical protein